MAKAVESDVVTKLAAASLGLTVGNGVLTSANLFAGPRRPIADGVPANAVFVNHTGGGPPPMPYIHGATGAKSFKETDVQVWVRSNPDDYTNGLSLTRSCMDALHLATLTGYVDCRLMQSQPHYWKMGSNDPHEWSFRLRLKYEE